MSQFCYLFLQLDDTLLEVGKRVGIALQGVQNLLRAVMINRITLLVSRTIVFGNWGRHSGIHRGGIFYG
ncbi:hypothetical protein CSQ95_21690 [Janthinobacterium sp. BJB304]|nr:hypothetical protein CSQ95_21690 [Janthinobacterium sp. BJB304]